MKKLISVFAMVALVSIAAEARKDQHREARQQGRIGQGVKSGELTKHEAHKLHRGQKRVDNAQAEAKEDGVVSKQERKKLRRMQNRQSAAIYKQKHDGQSRPDRDAGAPSAPSETPAESQ